MGMNDPTLGRTPAERLADFIASIRTDWDAAGILTALGHARTRGDAWQVAIAAIRAASDPNIRTPAVIALDGRHWRPETATEREPPTRTPSNVADMRCPRCGFWVVAGEEHTCKERANNDTAHTHAEQARTAARTAPRPQARREKETTP